MSDLILTNKQDKVRSGEIKPLSHTVEVRSGPRKLDSEEGKGCDVRITLSNNSLEEKDE